MTCRPPRGQEVSWKGVCPTHHAAIVGDLAVSWEPRPVLALRSAQGGLYPYNSTGNVFDWDMGS